MRQNRSVAVLFIFAGPLIVCETAPAREPLGTAWTYQGKVDSRGAPLNGDADFAFSLWDEAGIGAPPSGGHQIGTTRTISKLPVVDGLFTVELDFGPTAFNGDRRFLQIAVRSPAGAGLFTTLSPRQEVTPAPYALFALDAPTGGSSYWAASGNHIHNTNSGNVGIGTNTPDRLLDVNGTATIGGSLFFDSPATFEIAHDNNTGMRIDPVANNVHLEADNLLGLTLTSGGRVGIGTANPVATLDVRGRLVLDDGGDALVYTAATGGEQSRYVKILNSTTQATASGLMAGGVLVSDNYAYANPAKDQLIVKGAVGIGTPTPTSRLTVEGIVESGSGGFKFPDGSVQTTAVSGVAGDFSLPYSGTVSVSSTAFSVTNNGTGRTAYFESTNDGEAIRAVSYTDNAAITAINNGTGNAAFFQNFNGTANTVNVSSFADGIALNSIQLGDGGPAGRFEVNNAFSAEPAISAVITGGTGDAIDAEGDVSVDGDVVVTGDVCAANLTCPSDARFKTGVKPLADALGKLVQLRAVAYDWKRDAYPDRHFSEDRQIGLIAQEVRDVLPEVVHEDRDGYLSVDYGRLTPLLVEAVKELNQVLDQKDAQIVAIRAEKNEQIRTLTDRLERLEAIVLQSSEEDTAAAP